MDSLPGYDRWLEPPDDYPDMTQAPVTMEGVCRCKAYKFPHRVSGGDCPVCAHCYGPSDHCGCSYGR